MGLFKTPDWLGANTYEGVPDEEEPDLIWLEIPGFGAKGFPRNLLTEIVPVVPDEPEKGTVVFDCDGDAWHHKDEFWWFGSRFGTWEELNTDRGPLTPYGQAPLAQPGTWLPLRTDLVSQLPAEFYDAGGRRKLLVDWGKHAGQLKFQGVEGEAFSRAVIIEREDALALAWTVLAAAS